MDDGGRDTRLVLASRSPRRQELLGLAGFQPVIRPAAVDERPHGGEEPERYVARLAREKAAAVIGAANEVVLAADTTVVVDGGMLGKPADAAEAAAMLRRLAGRAHTVSTGVAVLARAGRLLETVVTTEVVFAALGDAAVEAYVATGEPLDKAGGYAIQGRAAAFVRRIAGSWTNVVGLPVVETVELLAGAGLTSPWEDPRRTAASGGARVGDPSAPPAWC